jgi:hypothetical protein
MLGQNLDKLFLLGIVTLFLYMENHNQGKTRFEMKNGCIKGMFRKILTLQ